MSEKVNMTCPGCQTTLRIPVAWVNRTIKCKTCGTAISGGTAVPTPAPVPTAADAELVPVIVLPDTPQPSSEMFADDAIGSRPKYRPAKAPNKVAWAVAAVVGMGAITLGILFDAGLFGKGNPTKSSESPPAVGKSNDLGKESLLNTASTPFPRRLLFISISRYAFLNPLTTGEGARRDVVSEAAHKMAYEWQVPTDPKNDQVYFLCDTAHKDASPAVKSVVQPTYEKFFATSRAQDRIVVYFGGHAVEKDGKAYLVPSDGDLDDTASLIPVDEFYAKLKACPAQQKVVIFDVCRFNPQFGRQRPGSEPMSEPLAKALHAPPAGVQVWTACSAGENSVELPKTGSEFLAAFRLAADTGNIPSRTGRQDGPIPVTAWADAVKKKVAELVTKDGKPAQTPQLTGSEPATNLALDAKESPAKRFELPALPKGADPAVVAAVFRDLQLPGIRDDQATDALSFESAFYFPAGVMKDFTEADVPLAEMAKHKEKYAIRLAALDAMKTIRETWTRTKGDGAGRLRETFVGEADEKTKKMIEEEQTVPARIELDLETLIRRMDVANQTLDKEPSKRWRATFQYAYAQALVRWAYINEYDLMLGAIRKNELPTLHKDKGESGWQMISVEKMRSKADVKEKAEAAKELFAKIATDYKGTPWALLAKQHLNIAVGLEWRTFNPSEGTIRNAP